MLMARLPPTSVSFLRGGAESDLITWNGVFTLRYIIKSHRSGIHPLLITFYRYPAALHATLSTGEDKQQQQQHQRSKVAAQRTNSDTHTNTQKEEATPEVLHVHISIYTDSQVVDFFFFFIRLSPGE